MTWYYAFNNEQQGPVDEAELGNLVQQGVVTPTTLVWREGMTAWQTYREVMPAGVTAGPVHAVNSPVGLGGSVVCAECGQAFAPTEVIRIGNRSICATCKPIAVQKLREGVATDSNAERIRAEHIKHEASVKSVAILYFLGAGLLFFASMMFIVGPPNPQGRAFGAGLGIGLLAVAGVQVWAGIGLRQLRPWARIVSGILSGLGLLGFPLGTLINAYILYLLFSKKGTMVFSEEYQRVIEETPHIKYKTSVVVWILLGLLLALFALAVMAGFFARTHVGPR